MSWRDRVWLGIFILIGILLVAGIGYVAYDIGADWYETNKSSF